MAISNNERRTASDTDTSPEAGSSASSQDVTLEDARQRLIVNTMNSLTASKKQHDEQLEETNKKIKQLNESVAKVRKDTSGFQKRLEDRLRETEDGIRTSEIRGVQVLGTLAALIALILAYVDIAKSFEDVLNAILVLLAATFGIVLFVVLINQLLDKEGSRSTRYRRLLLIVVWGLAGTVLAAALKTYILDPWLTNKTEEKGEVIEMLKANSSESPVLLPTSSQTSSPVSKNPSQKD